MKKKISLLPGRQFVSLFLMGLFIGTSIYSQGTLKDAFKDYFLIGTALNDAQVSGKDKKSIEVVRKEFNSITPENLLKWEKVHPEPGKYNFEPADRFVEFGIRNGMFIVGHTLVWHNQTPAWVFEDSDSNSATKDTLLQRMKNHIFSVVGRYKGKINGWDVVNEAFDDNGEYRRTKWFEIIGEEFIEKAFQWAHEADPDAELYYNDFNMWYKGRVESVVKLVKKLKKKGIKIDGVGLQGHWGLDYPPLDELEESFEKFSQLGVKIMITELDLTVVPFPTNDYGADITKSFELRKKYNPFPEELPDSMHVVQSERYAAFFNIFNKYKENVSRVTLWGVGDAQSWRNFWPIMGRKDYPLLFDRNLEPKPAHNAVIKTVTGK